MSLRQSGPWTTVPWKNVSTPQLGAAYVLLFIHLGPPTHPLVQNTTVMDIKASTQKYTKVGKIMQKYAGKQASKQEGSK